MQPAQGALPNAARPARPQLLISKEYADGTKALHLVVFPADLVAAGASSSNIDALAQAAWTAALQAALPIAVEARQARSVPYAPRPKWVDPL